MRVVIFRKGNAVIVDGAGAPVDCSGLQACIHAIEWDSTYATGHIEYVNDRFAPEVEYLPNETITDFSPYQDFIDLWQEARDAMAAAEAEQLAKMKLIEEQRSQPPLNLTFPPSGGGR